LTVTKTADDSTVAPGDGIIYEITYANSSTLGNQDAIGVTLTEILPVGTTFDPVNSDAGWVETPAGSGIYVYTVGPLDSGDVEDTVDFAVTVNSTVAAGQESIVNAVTITDDSLVPVTDIDDTVILEAAPDLAVTVTDGLTQVGAGQLLTYTIGYSNVGSQGATGVKLEIDLSDSNLTFSPDDNPDYDWTQSGDTLTYLMTETVAAQASGSLPVKLRVASSVVTGDTITANVTITDDTTNGAEPDTENNGARDIDTVGGVDLAITKNVSTTSAIVGQAITYTITVTNVGAGAASGITVSDVLPGGTTYVSATAPAGFTIAAPGAGSAGTVTFSEGSLAASASATFTLVVQIGPESRYNSISNTATVASSVTDMNPSNNSATSAATQLRMNGVGLFASSVDPTKNDLIIGGSPLRDTIAVMPLSSSSVRVYMNGRLYGPYTVTGRIIAYAHGGSDYVTVATTCTVPAMLFGGDGNDILFAGGGATALIGGAGNDTLIGARKASILIGGTGSDMLRGLTGAAILVGGSSVYDAHEFALTALLNEWSRDLPYWKRVSHVYDGGEVITPVGLNGTYCLRRSTLLDDNARDYLLGSTATDFFFTPDAANTTRDLTSGLVKSVEWLRSY